MTRPEHALTRGEGHLSAAPGSGATRPRKAIVISPLLPFPVDTGKKMVLAGILRFLVQEYGAPNVTWLCLGSADATATSAEIPELSVIMLGGIGRIRQVLNLAWHVLLKRRMAIQEATFWSSRMLAVIAQAGAALEPDLIVYDTVRVASYRRAFANPSARHVLHMEDLFSLRYRRMLDVGGWSRDVRLDALGNFGENLPRVAAIVLRWRPLQRWLLQLESALISVREREVTREFHDCLLLNAAEARELAASTASDNVHALPPATGIEVVQRPRSPETRPTFVFLGSLGFPANYVSITRFLDRQMNRVLALLPNARVIIVGRGADAELERRARAFDGAVVLEGYVPDLDDVLRRATAMIVPLLFGSGIKLKTLEAMARGVPVLATDYGIEGIPAIPGIHCVRENDLGCFPERMRELCDPETNARIGVAGQELFLSTYSRPAVESTYRRCFGWRHGAARAIGG